jgi:hypothetical protein
VSGGGADVQDGGRVVVSEGLVLLLEGLLALSEVLRRRNHEKPRFFLGSATLSAPVSRRM